MIFFPNLLGQSGSMEFSGSYGKISKAGNLKSRLKWYMEGAWSIFVNKPIWISNSIQCDFGFQERFNSTFEFKSSFKYSFEFLKYIAYIETSGII